MNSLGNHGAFSHGIKFRHQLRGKPATLLRVEITDLLGPGLYIDTSPEISGK